MVYLADCLSSKETLDKYRIGFIYDIGAYIDTLEKVKTMQAKMLVPAHAAAVEDISELAQYNIDKVLEVADRITELCAVPTNFEAILQQLFSEYGLAMTFEQYVLVGSTVKSFLAWMKDAGKMQAEIQDNMLVWSAL